MTGMEMAFRAACQKNEKYTDVVATAAENIATARAEAEAKAEEDAKRKAAEEEEKALQEKRKSLKKQVERQNALTLFGFSYSPWDYAMRCGVIWAESLEAAKEKVSRYKNASVWELNRGADVVIVGEYFE